MDKELYLAACQAREKAYAPYSNFQVGAALRTVNDKIFCGTNVENSSYGLTSCAERNAIFNAVTAGERVFKELCIVADTPEPILPCGACLQVMLEFKIEKIFLTNCQGAYKEITLAELLPYGFKLKK